MKKLTTLILMAVLCGAVWGQEANKIIVNDTRSVTSTPKDYDHEVKFEFKYQDIIGLNTSGYSGLMTFAPWRDNTGGYSHQLGFNDKGLFYRNGLPESTNWNSWRKLIVESVNKDVDFEGGLYIRSNKDNVINLHNTDNSWQYITFNRSNIRKAYFGLTSGNDLKLAKENGGSIILDASQIAITGGNVGIATTTPSAKLDVAGNIKAHEIEVTLAAMQDLQLNGTLAANNITYTANGNTADFVFEDNYHLRDLTEVEAFIKTNKHLPEIPSAAEMEEVGVNLAEMNKLLLMKVEELTLYSIQLEKEVKRQKAEVSEVRSSESEVRKEMEKEREERRVMRGEIEELKKLVMELIKTSKP